MRPRARVGGEIGEALHEARPVGRERAPQRLGIGRQEIGRRERVDVLLRQEHEAAPVGSGQRCQRSQLVQIFRRQQIALLHQREVGELAPLARGEAAVAGRAAGHDGQRRAGCPPAAAAAIAADHNASQRGRYFSLSAAWARRRRGRPRPARAAKGQGPAARGGSGARKPEPTCRVPVAPIPRPTAASARRARSATGSARDSSAAARWDCAVTRQAQRGACGDAAHQCSSATCASAMTAMPSPISVSCFTVSSGSGRRCRLGMRSATAT